MSDFSNYLSPGRKGHLVGIGGVSMSSLAEVLKGMGIGVTGSDTNEGYNVRQLREKGILISDVLQNNDAYHALKEVDGLVITGPTGTNVNDVAVALVV